MPDITEFLTARVPDAWFNGPLAVEWDDDEIQCVGTLPSGTSIESFREATRATRMEIAGEAESHYGRTVSWGVVLDGVPTLFTTVSSPAMTRLRLRERAVLDTLVNAGVARSRSDALAWCVKLVASNEASWLGELREALVGVEHVRATGPVQI